MQEALDDETWQVVEVPQNYNDLIERLHNPEVSFEVSSGLVKQLVSDDINYWATRSLLVLLSCICKYIDFIEGVKEVAFEAFCSLIELIKVLIHNQPRCIIPNPDSCY